MTTKELQAQLDEVRDRAAERYEWLREGVETYRAGHDSLAPLVIELAEALQLVAADDRLMNAMNREQARAIVDALIVLETQLDATAEERMK